MSDVHGPRHLARAPTHPGAWSTPLSSPSRWACWPSSSAPSTTRWSGSTRTSSTPRPTTHGPTPGSESVVETWEMLSQPWVMYLLLGLPVSLYVWFARDLRTRAWWALATMAAGWGLAALLKLLVGRARPEIDDPVAQHVGYSFPSGHATNNAIVVTVAILLVWNLVEWRASAASGRPRFGLGGRDVCRPALRRRPLPVRRHGRRPARVRARGCLVRGLRGLAPASSDRGYDEMDQTDPSASSRRSQHQARRAATEPLTMATTTSLMWCMPR